LSGGGRLVSVGRVGRAHGRDGSFYVEGAEHSLREGTEVELAGRARRVERRAGSDERPLVRLSELDGRADAVALQGERLLVPESAAPLEEGEWLAAELVGLRVDGLGQVRRVLDAPSCAVLELEDGTLVPLVSDAVRSVRPTEGEIDVDLGFLGLER
jgi:16S rRNA processing protein RimM